MTLQANPEGTCEACGKTFQRWSSFQRVCKTPRCAGRIVKMDKRKEAEETRARRIGLRSRRDWLEDTQKAVNAYVRARDRGLPCVCCGAPWDETFQAGHYLSRGARPELRFNLDNIHGQSVRCNMHLHGNQAAYRKGLVERIGLARVEALEGPHPPAKYSIDELRTMREAFRILTKQALEK